MKLVHPFGEFVPRGARYLILGSFPGKEVFDRLTRERYHWYYCTQANQFWPIMEKVYGRDLMSLEQKKKLLKDLKMAIGDTIDQCRRERGSNLDSNLTDIVYNLEGIEKVLMNNKIETIFFSSRWVEKIYKSKFRHLTVKYPEIILVTLPCPSPRYFRMKYGQKVDVYKKLLPKLKV